MNDLSNIPALALLTDAEAQFVYNVEVLLLPAKRAADMAGMPFAHAYADHIKQARELVKAEVNSNIGFTKEDVVRGMHDAIGRARIINEPMTEIVGWEKIAKIMGLEASQKVDVNVTSTLEVINGNMRNLSDEALTRLVGAGHIIDGAFYEVAPAKQIPKGD